MSINPEIEFKQLISKSVYYQIIDDFNLTNAFKQTNHYFDTPSMELKKRGMALRIRHYSDVYEMTLKVPTEEGLLEYNSVLDESVALSFKQHPQFINQEALVYLQTILDVSTLKWLVSFETTRYEWPYLEGTLFLDANTMPFHIDYELEYEVNSFKQSLNDWQELIHRYQLEPVQAKSKVYRACHSKKID